MFSPTSMILSRRVVFAALAASLLAATGVAAQTRAAAWSANVSVSAIGAHIIGNPAAKLRLVEYFSYTCHVCADFAKAGTAPLKTQYVDTGLVQVEYRNLVRDPVDMTAALLARCGGAMAFAGNHDAIFAAWPTWFAAVQKASDAQMERWYEGSVGERARRIAADTGLAALMLRRGYTQSQLNACLDSEVAQTELAAMTNIGHNADRVSGTPTFFINGRNAEVVHWSDLKSRLDLALKPS